MTRRALTGEMQSTEEGMTVFGEDFPAEKILEWNVEGQILIPHTEDRIKGHYR